MRRIGVIVALSFVFFLMEFFLFNLLGRWFKPNLLLLLVLFFNFYLGIRYSLITALIAGFLKDSFSLNTFGCHIFSFVLCAFLTTVTKKYLFHTSAQSLRILLAFFMSILNVLVLYILNSMFIPLDFDQVFKFVLIPEVLATTLVANATFWQLKKCVLKFSVG